MTSKVCSGAFVTMETTQTQMRSGRPINYDLLVMTLVQEIYRKRKQMHKSRISILPTKVYLSDDTQLETTPSVPHAWLMDIVDFGQSDIQTVDAYHFISSANVSDLKYWYTNISKGKFGYKAIEHSALALSKPKHSQTPAPVIPSTSSSSSDILKYQKLPTACKTWEETGVSSWICAFLYAHL